ncbi:hypothetical protein NDU88_003025 [Pleurodeles waltl]|uniref:Uncharacterized protein n=1 Tax=Pleurodeles waltl TaxID=8319 RepID=A0AAV7LHM0_PLEWA|nr:hypothetical protein NDU88_003025 [Pleurodeles waltl]
MSTERRSYSGEESGAAHWSRATLELRRSRRAAACISLREANQAEIRLACESLEKKIDLLALGTQAFEESVETMREDLRRNKEEIQQLKGTERDLQEKLEYLENNSRRNNLRILNVPEGVEGSDLKRYVVSLIKKVNPLDETEDQNFNDIQRVQHDPFRRNTNSKNPWRILANFQTYSLKERIPERH